MLSELRVRDLAVIADVTLPFQPGLNVITGETGAGKSMLVDALALLLGERASTEAVRAGADKAIIEGAFEFGTAVHRHLLSPFAALGIELDEGRLVLKREVLREGKSRAWINGSPTTVGMLGQVGALLVDLHGQHETQSLLHAEAQRDMLDAYGDADVERVAARDAHTRMKELEQRESELSGKQAEVRRKADYLRHMLQEIESAKPKVGEDDALASEARRLGHADELTAIVRDLIALLGESPLPKIQKLLARLTRLDPDTARMDALLEAARANFDELQRSAEEYALNTEADPDRLGVVLQRRDVLFRLQQKYGPSIPDVLAARDSAARELELLDTADLDLRNIGEERASAVGEFARATAALTKKREAAAKKLARAVNKLLPSLGMVGGRFSVQLVPRTAHHAHGAEDVIFDVKLNEGLDPRPLARVASGGELSRLMLALKVVLAAHDAVPTLVFDEVDQGIGGEVGARVGEALRDVSRGGRQALVITHLPQIAVYAEQQLVVAKGAKGGIATSDVRVATGAARTQEIARMLGDADMATARRHAEELLKMASGTSAAAPETPRPQEPSRPQR